MAGHRNDEGERLGGCQPLKQDRLVIKRYLQILGPGHDAEDGRSLDMDPRRFLA